jgi:hypothetical protein
MRNFIEGRHAASLQWGEPSEVLIRLIWRVQRVSESVCDGGGDSSPRLLAETVGGALRAPLQAAASSEYSD